MGWLWPLAVLSLLARRVWAPAGYAWDDYRDYLKEFRPKKDIANLLSDIMQQKRRQLFWTGFNLAILCQLGGLFILWGKWQGL